jgi:hypothetical protein
MPPFRLVIPGRAQRKLHANPESCADCRAAMRSTARGKIPGSCAFGLRPGMTKTTPVIPGRAQRKLRANPESCADCHARCGLTARSEIPGSCAFGLRPE